MKTCEEMAQSVMVRAKAYKRRKRWIMSTTAAVCVFGICLGMLATNRPVDQNDTILQVQQPLTTTTEPTGWGENVDDNTVLQPVRRVTLLHCIADGSQAVEMEEDVKLPYRMLIRIRDTSGVTDEQMSNVYKEEQEYIDEVFAAYPEKSRNSWGRYRGENVLITTLSVGGFVVRLDDPDGVESVRISVTDVGHMRLLSRLDYDHPFADGNFTIDLGEEDIKKACEESKGDMVMGWMISNKTAQNIKEDPSVPLSSFRDSVSIAVTFKDGVVETHLIDIVVEDSGEIYTIYRGQTETM